MKYKLLITSLIFLAVSFSTRAQFYIQERPYNAVVGEKINLKTYGSDGLLQWQESNDTLVWKDLSGLTEHTVSTVVQSSTSKKVYYRVKAINGNSISYSKIIKYIIWDNLNAIPNGEKYHGGLKSGIDINGNFYALYDNEYLYNKWGLNDTLTSANDVNDGLQNTKKIADIAPLNSSNPAVFCNNLVVSDYDDWYLPADNENLFIVGNEDRVGGTRADDRCFWSSTEHSLNSAGATLNLSYSGDELKIKNKLEVRQFFCTRKVKLQEYKIVFEGVCQFNKDSLYTKVFNLNTDTIRAKVCVGSRVEIRYTGSRYNNDLWCKGKFKYNGSLSFMHIGRDHESGLNFVINSVSSSDAGMYYVLLSGSDFFSAPLLLEVVDLQAYAGKDFAFCSNVTTELKGVFNSTYKDSTNIINWSPSLFINNPNILNPTIKSNVPTTFYYSVENVNTGCKSYDMVTVTPEVDVNIISQPSSVDECLASTISNPIFSVSATGDNIKYQWKKGAQSIIDGNNSTWLKSSLDLTDEGVYTCDLSNSCRTISTNPVDLKVIKLDLNIGTDRSFCNDNAIQLNAIASSNHPEFGALQYSWSSENLSSGVPHSTNGTSPAVGLNDSHIPNPLAQPLIDLYYYLKITEPKGCFAQNMFRLNSITSPSFTKPITDTAVCSTNSWLYPNVNGTNLKYEWYVDNQFVSSFSSSNSLLQLSGTISSIEAAKYRLKVSNSCKTIESPDFKIKVMDYTTTMPSTFILCNGDTKNLDFTFTSNHPENQNYIYNWSPSNGLSSTSIKNPGVTLNTSTNYYVSATDKYGCNLGGSIQVVVSKVKNGENICLVTVDQSLGKNKIILNKTPNIGADLYLIYKETGLDSYSQIGSINADQPGEFIDLFSTPESHGDKYKITIIDTCGNESSKSFFHKTINLTIASYNSTIGLNWNKYEDESNLFKPFRYYIFKGSSQNNMQLLDSVSGSITSYNDLNVVGLQYYMIGVKKDGVCNFNKSSSSFSYSNLKANMLSAGLNDNYENTNWSVIPNPFNQEALITLPNESQNEFSIQLLDYSGKIVFKDFVKNQSTYILKNENLRTGVYFLEIQGNKIYRTRLVIN